MLFAIFKIHDRLKIFEGILETFCDEGCSKGIFYGAGAKIRIVGLRLHPKKGKKLKITLNSKNFKLNFFFSLAVFDKSRLNKIAKTKGFLRGVKKINTKIIRMQVFYIEPEQAPGAYMYTENAQAPQH